VRSFLADACVVETGAIVSKETLYEQYVLYCTRKGIKGVLADTPFATALYDAEQSVKPTRPREDGKQVPSYSGIRLSGHHWPDPFVVLHVAR